MLNFFKHNYLAQQIVIVVMALVLWIPTFVMKSELLVSEGNVPLFNTLISVIGFSPLLIKLLAFAVNLVSVFLFNSILSANRLVNKYSSVGAFSFLLMMCSCTGLDVCFPFIFACPFILMAMHTMFLIYQTDTPENYMMNIGYFIAIASMFYYPSVFLMIWVVISFLILGFNKIRYTLIPITGFLVVNAIMIGLTYIFGDVKILLESYSSFFRNISFSFELSYGDKMFFIISSVLFVVSILRIISNRSSDKGSNIRKRVGVAIVLTLLAIILLFIQKPTNSNALILMMFAFFYAITLSDIKKSKIASTIMILMLLFVIVKQYLPLYGITL